MSFSNVHVSRNPPDSYPPAEPCIGDSRFTSGYSLILNRPQCQAWAKRKQVAGNASAKQRQSVCKASAQYRHSVSKASAKHRESIGKASARCGQTAYGQRGMEPERRQQNVATASTKSVATMPPRRKNTQQKRSKGGNLKQGKGEG